MRTILKLFAALALLAAGSGLHAQEHPARRLSSIVGVAVEEYAKGVDDRGRLTSELEYGEAVDFLNDARGVAERLSGDRAPGARLLLDSLVAAVAGKRPAPDVAALHQRFVAALGSEGALELPARPLDLASGRAIYQRSCAQCHGAAGDGKGPAAAAMNPPPPALGDPEVMRDVTPALMYRVLSVGIAGTPMKGWSDELSPEQRWDVVAYLQAMRATEAERLEGEGIFLQRCAACHGAAGGGDGSAAAALTRLPPEIGSFAWQVERSDAQIAAAIRDGLPGSAMPPARDLGDAELARAVAFVRSIPVRQREVPAQAVAAAASADPALVARRVLAVVDQALAAAQAGRRSDAGDLAFDAYIAFEPLETEARAKSPGLVATMEKHFAELKAAVKGGDLRGAERSRNGIEAGLPAIVELTSNPTGPWAAFLQSLLIILREGFEAILVVGAVVTFLIKTGNRHRLRAIWMGVGVALAASAATAVILQTALRALPATREIIEGITMLIAVAVLFSVSYWLISKVEAAKWQQFIREKVQTALAHGGERALAVVAFLAVYREGAETALFYQALFNEGANVALPIGLGIVVGGALLAAIFVLFYRFGVKIPLRPFFGATSVLLYYMAFVFMGKGIRELQEGNALPITLIPGFPEAPALGIFPTVETLLAQLLLVALFVLALVKTFWPKRSVALPTVPPAAAAAPAADTELTARVAALQGRVEALERTVAAELGEVVSKK
ncbi:MAG TPA: FTR1 family protein [Gemmatimonadaceae bacterium]|nr:FTR1 family protein [Gemmatimonadaceae bacterium]